MASPLHSPPPFPVSLRWLVTGPLLLILALLAAAPLRADTTPLKDYAAQLKTIERGLRARSLEEAQLRDWLAQISVGAPLAEACVSEGEQARQQMSEDLASLGEPVKGEAAEVARKRRELKQRIQALDQRLATCRLLVLRSAELKQLVSQRLKALLARHLFAKGPNVLVLLLDNWKQPAAWLAATLDFLREHSGVRQFDRGDWGLLLGALLLATAVGALLRHQTRRLLQHAGWDSGLSSEALRALLGSLGHYAPQLLAGLAAAGLALAVTGGQRPIPFVSLLGYAMPVYFLGIVLIRFFLAPPPPARLFLPLDAALARALARRLKVLLALAFVGYLLFATLFAQSLPEPAILLARALFAAVLVLNLMWALWLVLRLPRLADMRWFSLLIYLVLLGALAAEWLGYRNLSVAALRVLLGSLLAFGLLVFLAYLLRDLYDNLDEGHSPWARRLRHALGLVPEAPFPGLVWLRLITTLLLWGLGAYAVLGLWGVSDTTLQQLRVLLVQGFEIGSLEIVPLRILAALLSFAVLFALSGWVRNRMEHRWLQKARMDRGAREALVTISGYVMIALALVVGLGVAGFEFKNLAIIAGALSVGIGFGLQNIVNNFVSGLILLFERPVKTGDWIVVGNTEGYVKRIRIRSTQIQTFDRADVIVPNSELISNQVTNWMLYDARGRARIPVGVAYGSDTQQVKAILERVAAEHPGVITDGSSPEPRVLFRAFGDSSLDFELRCFIYDIDKRLRVISDLNFAIDAAFREAGIEIPFPQRDVHVRDWPSPPEAGS
ncbi:mechanosensitive ion channel [Thiohalobacter sp. IOR34]|uniref:mechanosensitive ion channel family protein n=1 Tax=Thiohalobacter sp. IOR34 TaxID=3057176 RepID=UPI0025B14B73|nr:mechanosensitive ion channel domain-containing protein [Thiohalobacter sp. IOR34]WJW76072.1 mechanosensitive ion channel [Thiohalobacter sp. IOR34]